MTILAVYPDFEFLELTTDGDYIHAYTDDSGEWREYPVYLDPGGPPRRVRTWRPVDDTPQVFDPRPIEEWM